MYFVELAKYFFFTILACLDTSTYVGMTAIDFGARAIYASAYVGLSRAGLQLPVGAFVPPPPHFSAGSLMLYTTPAAVASWPSVVDALYHVPKALDVSYRTVRDVAVTLAAHHQRLAPSLIHAPPSFLTTSQSAYASVSWSPHAESSPGLPSPAYRRITFPVFNLSSSSTLLHDTILGLSSADPRAPFLAAIGLGQRIPRGVLPIQQDSVAQGMEVEDAESPVVCETPMPTESERSMEVVANEFPLHLDQNYNAVETVIIIHLRSCLIGLFALACLLFVVYKALRQILRLLGWMPSKFTAVLCLSVLSIVCMVVDFTLGVCARLLARRKPTRAAPVGSDADPHTDILPPSPPQPPSAIEATSTHARPVDAAAPPVATPGESPSPKSAGKKKKNKRNKKKKAGSGSVTVVDPVDVPLPPDDGQGRAVSPAMIPLPLSPPPSPLLDAVIPPLSLPPPVSDINPLLADVPSVSLVETVRADNEQRAEPPKDLTAPIDASFAPPSEQAGVAFAADGESGQDDGGDWTVVERKRKPRRALKPILGAAPTSDRKTKRGGRAGK
ncbi:hypothetical protein RhiLY_06425 [Ceratobasidium sp. AG-Ba]|nr:hypothetical protein RhiLY_06425 [Ceratobasidium sp. AG-Ba]